MDTLVQSLRVDDARMFQMENDIKELQPLQKKFESQNTSIYQLKKNEDLAF